MGISSLPVTTPRSAVSGGHQRTTQVDSNTLSTSIMMWRVTIFQYQLTIKLLNNNQYVCNYHQEQQQAIRRCDCEKIS
jgi:hypothetical protein